MYGFLFWILSDLSDSEFQTGLNIFQLALYVTPNTHLIEKEKKP